MLKVISGLGILALVGCASAPTRTATATAACEGIDSGAEAAKIYAEASSGTARRLVGEKHKARALQVRYTEGAEVTLPAPAGMSGEYIQRVLSCHAASGAAPAHPNDLVHGATASVKVESAGPGYRIAVRASNADEGEQIWEKAQALTQSGGAVEVEQVSAATPAARY